MAATMAAGSTAGKLLAWLCTHGVAQVAVCMLTGCDAGFGGGTFLVVVILFKILQACTDMVSVILIFQAYRL